MTWKGIAGSIHSQALSWRILLCCVLGAAPPPVAAETVPMPPERPLEFAAPPPAAEAVPLPPERPPEFTAPGLKADAPAADNAVPEEERACQQRLTQLGAAYTVLPALTGPGACGAPHPLELTALSARVTVTGKPTVTCRLAEALALWARDGLATSDGAAAVTSVEVGTSYQCRGRNHDDTAPLSEHAFANGVDIAAFRLADGRTIAVGSKVEEDLQAAIRRAACSAFMTVLGPGSPGHGEHWHFDMRQRRNDYRICQ